MLCPFTLYSNLCKLVPPCLISGVWILYLTAHTIILYGTNGNEFIGNVFFSIYKSFLQFVYSIHSEISNSFYILLQ